MFNKNDILVFSAILAKHGQSIETIRNFADFIERISLDEEEINQSLQKLVLAKQILIVNNNYSAFYKFYNSKATLNEIKEAAKNILDKIDTPKKQNKKA